MAIVKIDLLGEKLPRAVTQEFQIRTVQQDAETDVITMRGYDAGDGLVSVLITMPRAIANSILFSKLTNGMEVSVNS